MSGIVGGVFIVTMLGAIFGLIDRVWRAVRRWWKERRS